MLVCLCSPQSCCQSGQVGTCISCRTSYLECFQKDARTYGIGLSSHFNVYNPHCTQYIHYSPFFCWRVGVMLHAEPHEKAPRTPEITNDSTARYRRHNLPHFSPHKTISKYRQVFYVKEPLGLSCRTRTGDQLFDARYRPQEPPWDFILTIVRNALFSTWGHQPQWYGVTAAT